MLLRGVLDDSDRSGSESLDEDVSDVESFSSETSFRQASSDDESSDPDDAPPPCKRPAHIPPKGRGRQPTPARPAAPVKPPSPPQPAASPQPPSPPLAARGRRPARGRRAGRVQPPSPPQPAQIVAPDGTVWKTEPSRAAKAVAANILTQAPGPKNLGGASTMLDLFELFLPAAMLQIILANTNIHGLANQGRQWINVAMIEIRSTIGLLLFLGLTKSGHENIRTLWRQGYFSRAICQATMSGRRFQDIQTMLSFDDQATREQRKADDKFAPIREVFDMFTSACRRHFSPGECLTIDEQLVSFRGRCPFRQYMPAKPAKYGLKFWACVDSENHYVCNMQPYIGQQGGQRERELGSRVVKDLVAPYFGTGRNVTADNFFVSKDLAEQLLTQKMTLVGTIKGNRREVPKEMRKESFKGRAEKSSKFLFSDMTTLVSFMPKKNRNVTLISTKHHDKDINATTQKPEVIHYYNSTKAGVDTVDQLCSLYNCSRITKRWPLVVFYNMINIAAINALVLWQQLNPGWKRGVSNKRHTFIHDLIQALVEPQLQMRLANSVGLQNNTRLAMRYLGHEVAYNLPPQEERLQGNVRPQGRCHLCPLGPNRTRTTRICAECNRFACTIHSNSVRVTETCCGECATDI